jgi:hypothetical protein
MSAALHLERPGVAPLDRRPKPTTPAPRARRAVAAADRAVARVIETVEHLGLIERTTFIVTGYHGSIDFARCLWTISGYVTSPMHRWIASTRSAGTQGFGRCRSHPARIALTRSCGRSAPVNAMMGIPTVCGVALSCLATSHPSISGNPRSSTITFGAHVLASVNAFSPVAAGITS